MLTCKELIEYLSMFEPDEGVAVVLADIDKRLAYKATGCQLIKETPALLFEIGGSEPLDEILVEAED